MPDFCTYSSSNPRLPPSSSSRRCRPSLVEPVPRRPSTTSVAPVWSVPDDVQSLEPPPAVAQGQSSSLALACCISVPPPLKHDPGELPAPLWLHRMKIQRVLLTIVLGLPSSGELQWSHHHGSTVPLPPLAEATEGRLSREERSRLDHKKMVLFLKSRS
jgi:hypothetical protein